MSPSTLIQILSSALLLMITVSAAPGDLDPTFGSGGKVLATVPDSGAANDIAIQPDGKIVIASTTQGPDGRSDFLVIRINQDGSVDTGFGVEGKVAIPFDEFSNETPMAIAVQSDGKILIGGFVEFGAPGWDFGVARLNSDGTLDGTFGNSGKLKIPVSSGDDFASDLLIQPDGKIVLIGKSRPTPNWDVSVIRMTPDGSLDLTFNGTGKRVFSIGGNDFASEAAITVDGKIVMVGGNGSDFAALRLNSNGSFDLAFGGTGIVTTPIGTQIDEAHAITLQPDGKILAGGWGNSGSFNFASLVRYNGDGSLDVSFDNDGIVSVAAGSNATAVFNSVIVLTDGKILAAGSRRDTISTGDFILTRYMANGAIDAAFGTAGVVRTTFGVDGSSLYYIALWRKVMTKSLALAWGDWVSPIASRRPAI